MQFAIKDNDTGFQSTHPRGVRPTWAVAYSKERGISIHAPARGATGHRTSGHDGKNHFNPRTREGCDKVKIKSQSGPINFNPRTREGCDIVTFTISTTTGHFNPRTREGCDFFNGVEYTQASDFNPRTREGCDALSIKYWSDMECISIHAPARGATLKKEVSLYTSTGFQSTHPRGVRQSRKNRRKKR